MDKIGIIQPGRIGDLIICMPIAKHYADLGYEVHWPIMKEYYTHFKDVNNYVKYISMDVTSTGIAAIKAREYCTINGIKMLDICFGGFGGDNENDRLWRKSGLSFDKFKYQLAKVPFEKKWQLDIVRNQERERGLYDKLVTSIPYSVLHTIASQKNVSNTNQILTDKYDLKPTIIISNITDNVFDWLMILQQAKKLCLIDSCFLNLVNQMNFTYAEECYIIRNIVLPEIKGNWRIL